MEWVSDSAATWSLKIDLAANIVASGLEHTLKATQDWREEFHIAMEMITSAFNKVQAATYSLALNYLWRRVA